VNAEEESNNNKPKTASWYDIRLEQAFAQLRLIDLKVEECEEVNEGLDKTIHSLHEENEKIKAEIHSLNDQRRNKHYSIFGNDSFVLSETNTGI